MERRTLGKTDLTVSRLCLGTMTFGRQADEATAAAMVDACLGQGIDFIDTANAYNAGQSEFVLGKVLKGRRDRVLLASKVGIKTGEGPDDAGLSRIAIARGIEDSLRRLQTDYLDIYYLHQPDYSVPLEETLAAADQLVRAGKVRYLGVSNYAAWQVCHLLWLAETHGCSAPLVVQPMYNLLARGIEQEFLPMCRQFGLYTLAYNPLAGGLLTGKHDPQAAIPGSRFDGNASYRDRYWHPANFQAVERLGTMARSAGRSLVSLALGWLLHHSPIDGLVLGASSLNQLQENLAAVDQGPLPNEIVAVCDEVWQQLRGTTPKYNR